METTTLDKCYLEYSNITEAMTMKERKLRQVVALLNSMILSGEQHSEKSEQMVKEVLGE